MTDTRDPRGIGSFFIRYLVLHAVFLLGFTLSYVVEIALIYFFGFIGFFTFLQVLIAIPRKFLDKAGSWKPVAIAGALLSDVAVLWWLGGIVSGFFVDSNWELVAIWLPFHFVAAFFAWGLREIFHSPDPQRTATRRRQRRSGRASMKSRATSRTRCRQCPPPDVRTTTGWVRRRGQ